MLRGLSQSCHQDVGSAVFSSEVLTVEEPTFKIVQVVNRIYLLVEVRLSG